MWLCDNASRNCEKIIRIHEQDRVYEAQLSFRQNRVIVVELHEKPYLKGKIAGNQILSIVISLLRKKNSKYHANLLEAFLANDNN